MPSIRRQNAPVLASTTPAYQLTSADAFGDSARATTAFHRAHVRIGRVSRIAPTRNSDAHMHRRSLCQHSRLWMRETSVSRRKREPCGAMLRAHIAHELGAMFLSRRRRRTRRIRSRCHRSHARRDDAKVPPGVPNVRVRRVFHRRPSSPRVAASTARRASAVLRRFVDDDQLHPRLLAVRAGADRSRAAALARASARTSRHTLRPIICVTNSSTRRALALLRASSPTYFLSRRVR